MQSNISMGGGAPPQQQQQQRPPQQQQRQQGAAGGSASQSNMGGYGTYDINKPSSRVLAPPGGASSNIFGGGPSQTPQYANTVAGQRAAAAAKSDIFGAGGAGAPAPATGRGAATPN